MTTQQAEELAKAIEDLIDAKVREYHESNHCDAGESGVWSNSHAESTKLYEAMTFLVDKTSQ